jgi:ubiquinone/menaquinone biosynthesis C-methylase UbiE
MKTVEETIMAAMDCRDKEILPWLPYILQDFWAIGTEPEIVISLIKKHINNDRKCSVLDLGCGKGAVSVKIAEAFRYECHGIDALAEFISFAKTKAEECNVNALCRFETGDIRERILYLDKFDIIILGSIGQVFGNYYDTLTQLKPHLTDNGIIIIDDGYVDDESECAHPQILTKYEMLRQLENAGMQLVDEVLADESLAQSYDKEYYNLARRCEELIDSYPKKAHLFLGYMEQQQKEYEKLKYEIICATMVVRRKDWVFLKPPGHA